MGDIERARVSFAPVGTPLPTDATNALASVWFDAGYLADDGLVMTYAGGDDTWPGASASRARNDGHDVINGEVVGVTSVDVEDYTGTSPLLLFPTRRAQLERCEGVEIVDNGDGTSTVYSNGVPLARVVAVDGQAVIDAYATRRPDPTLPVYRDEPTPEPFRNRAARRTTQRKGHRS